MKRAPLQNRVTPFGEIIATPERGMFMGNRGCLHDAHRQLTRRRWTSRRWITCVTEFRGWHREVMTPGGYTELFFLDEATAFAAGHRPCAECRHADYERFLDAWHEVHRLTSRPRADDIDAVLHRERLTPDRQKRRFRARLGELPDGVFVVTDGEPRIAKLYQHGGLLTWSPGGYASAAAARSDTAVEVLTPPSIVRLFAAGYRPVIHPSAERHTRR